MSDRLSAAHRARVVLAQLIADDVLCGQQPSPHRLAAYRDAVTAEDAAEHAVITARRRQDASSQAGLATFPQQSPQNPRSGSPDPGPRG
ncbi:MAG: hypothetical protein ACRDQA_23730 [Nocardioidaceae bacterium]